MFIRPTMQSGSGRDYITNRLYLDDQPVYNYIATYVSCLSMVISCLSEVISGVCKTNYL